MTAAAVNAIDIVDATVLAESSPILHGVTLSVIRDEVLGIIGPSGGGKTTLLRAMLGLNELSSGHIDVLGRPQGQIDPLLTLGVVYQAGALFTSLDAFENVAYPLREYGGLEEAEIERIVLHTLGRVGLADAVFRLPAQLSGGMVKRVAIARAIVLDPPIVLMDEPTAGLDPISADVVGRLIGELGREPGRTVVLTTHDLNLLRSTCGRVAVVSDHTVVACERLDALARLELPFVHSFLGTEDRRTPA